MVDMDYLKRCGVSSGAYKKIFTMDPTVRPPKVNQLVQLISDRIRRCRENNLRDYRAYAAIDLAYEAPFNQTTPTIVQSIISKRLSPDKTLELLKSWGLSEQELFLEITTTSGAKAKIPNPPVFYNILIPLVKAYTTIRCAKLFNDRNQLPLFPFTPLKPTNRNRVVCDIATDLVQTITTWYGYQAVLRAAINQMLKYGVAFAFPREEWHCEEQVTTEAGRDVVFTVKEGLRYVFPHPTRMGYDMQYPATSINTDSGLEYGLHWSVSRFGDVLDNRNYWNRRQITFGTNWFDGALASNYFNEVYPCALRHPVVDYVGTERREDRVAYYGANDRDSAVFLTEYFMKLIPYNWGLADYRYPVWHRFTVAADDVIIWCEPNAYNPMWMMGYDYDEQAARQSSFSLECIPWQDHLGNILSQMILTAKQNLVNLTYYDTNVVNADDITKIQNLGEQVYRSMMFVPYDSLKMARFAQSPQNAFHNIQFQFRDITQLVQAMGWALNMLERVLQMSSQEVGSTAQHYQSAKEIAVTQNATTNRLAHTGSFVDDGIDAWKRQVYEAAQAYMDATIIAQVDADVEQLDEILAELGFKVIGRDKKKNTVVVRGKKSMLRIEGFARDDSQSYRETDLQLAQVIAQTVTSLSTNPELFNAVGAKNILALLEQVAQLSGASREFKLRLDPNSSPGGVMAKVQTMMQELQQGMVQFVSEKVVQPAAQQAAQTEAKLTALEQVVQQLTKIYQVAQSQMDKNQAAVAEAQQRMQIRQAEFEQSQQQKMESHQLDMRRKMESAQIDAGIKTSQAQVTTATQAASGAASVQAQAAQSAAQLELERDKSKVQQEQAQIDSEHKRALASQESQAKIELQRRESAAKVEMTKAQASAAAKAKPKPAKSGA